MPYSPAIKLGKKPPQFDERTLRMARYFDTKSLPKIPLQHTMSKRTYSALHGSDPDGSAFGRMGNDRYGNCTCASFGHLFQTWTTYGRIGTWTPMTEDILSLYSKVNGGKDEGASMLDVLNVMRHDGLRDQRGGSNRIYAFAAVNPLNHEQVRTAHYLFGGLYVGLNLPASAML